MDFVVRAVEVPSLRDAVRKNRRARCNGLTFGISDRYGGIVSEPANAREVEAFRLARGFEILDARSGDRVDAGDPAKAVRRDVASDSAPSEPQREAPQVPQVPTDPVKEQITAFLREFAAASDSQRKRINNDEYMKVLKLMEHRVEADATKDGMIAQVAAELEARGGPSAFGVEAGAAGGSPSQSE